MQDLVHLLTSHALWTYKGFTPRSQKNQGLSIGSSNPESQGLVPTFEGDFLHSAAVRRKPL